MASTSSTSACIPTVNLTKSEDECVKALRAACRTTGFFFLEGHGVEEKLVDAVFAGGRSFFTRLDQKQKDKFKAKEGEHPFGYQSAVIENIKLDPLGQKLPDQREQLKFGRRNYLADYNSFMSNAQKGKSEELKDKDKNTKIDDPRVVWLSEENTEAQWRFKVNEYFEAVSLLGHKLIRMLALSLGLEGKYFEEFFDRALELMNINFYHATESNLNAGKLGCGAHTDYGMLTLLMTDHVPGLQVCRDKSSSKREWIDVEPRKNQFIVNVGDMLERWTNGDYLSNVHRVFNPSGRERLSIAFFFEPNVDALVRPISRGQGNQAREQQERTTTRTQTTSTSTSTFSEVIYGQWLADKYKKTGEVI